jgi:hypothetical protein
MHLGYFLKLLQCLLKSSQVENLRSPNGEVSQANIGESDDILTR